MSKTSSQHKNFRLICPLHKPCAKTGSLTKQRPSSPFCVAITDKSRRRKIPTCFNQPFRLTLTPMLPKMHPHSSMENSLTAPHQSGRSPTASEQSRQLTNKMPAHPSPRKKPFWRERRAQQKPAVAAIRQPTPNPTHLTAQMGSPPLLIHPASAASTACRYRPHLSFAAVLRRSAPVYPLRCWAILVVQHFFHKKITPYPVTSVLQDIRGEIFLFPIGKLTSYFLCLLPAAVLGCFYHCASFS